MESPKCYQSLGLALENIKKMMNKETLKKQRVMNGKEQVLKLRNKNRVKEMTDKSYL